MTIEWLILLLVVSIVADLVGAWVVLRRSRPRPSTTSHASLGDEVGVVVTPPPDHESGEWPDDDPESRLLLFGFRALSDH